METKTLNPRDYTSASNAQADTLCPGRYLAQQGMPDVSGPDADSGTRIHLALHTGNATQLSEAEYKTYESARNIEENVVEQWFTPAEMHSAIQVSEQRFWMQFVGPRPPAGTGMPIHHSGQPDKVYWASDRALIVEYKCGWNEVPSSAHNLQTRDHVVLVDQEIKPEVIGVVIIQPHITKTPQITVYHREDIQKSWQQLRERVIASHNPGSPRIAGEEQCQYCRAKMKCVEHSRWAASQLPQVRSFIDTPAIQWTPDQMRGFLEQYKKAQAWLEECHDYVKDFVTKNPGVVPGAYIRPGAIERPVDPDKVQDLFSRFEDLDGSLGSFLQCIDVNKGRLEQKVRDITGTRGKSLDNVMEVLLRGLTLEKPKAGSLKLKPLDSTVPDIV